MKIHMPATSIDRNPTFSAARVGLALLLAALLIFSDGIALAQEATAACTTNWTSPTVLLNSIETLSAVVNGQYLYSIGGYEGSTKSGVPTVGYVKLDSAGNLLSNTFTSTSSLNANLSRDLCGKSYTTTGGTTYLYTIGGVEYPSPTQYPNGKTTRDLEYAPINGDGTVGQWKTVPNALLVATQLHASVVLNNYLYVIGGSTTTDDQDPAPGITANVYHAKIDSSNGTVGKFVSDLTLPVPTYKTCPVVYDNTIYLSGGEVKITGSCSNKNPINPTATTNVWYATQGTDGALTPNPTTGTWNSATSMTQRLASQAVVYNGGILLIGGDTIGCNPDTASIEYGAFTDPKDNPPTKIEWTFPYPSSSVSLPEVIERNAGATYGSVIYSLGGEETSGGGSGDTNAVQCLVLP